MICTYTLCYLSELHQETCHLRFGLIRACMSVKVDEEPRIQKKLIPKCIFRRSEAQKNPLLFKKSRQVNE